MARSEKAKGNQNASKDKAKNSAATDSGETEMKVDVYKPIEVLSVTVTLNAHLN